MPSSPMHHRSRSMSFLNDETDFFSAQEVIVVMKQQMSEEMFQSSSLSCSSFHADFGTDTFGDFGDFADTSPLTPTFLPSHQSKTTMRRSSCTGRVQTSDEDYDDGWQEPHPTKPEKKTSKKIVREKATRTLKSQTKDNCIQRSHNTSSHDTTTTSQNSSHELLFAIHQDEEEQEFVVTSHSSLAQRKKMHDQLYPSQNMPRRSSCGPGYTAVTKEKDPALMGTLKSRRKDQHSIISQDQQSPQNISKDTTAKENLTSQSRLGRHFSAEEGLLHYTVSSQHDLDDASFGTSPTVSSFASGSLASSTRSQGRQQQRRMSCPGKSELDMQLSMETVKNISASSGIQW